MVDLQPPFRHQFFQIAIAEGEAEVPSYAEDDDLVSEVPAAKECRPIGLHVISTLSAPSRFVCNTSGKLTSKPSGSTPPTLRFASTAFISCNI